MEPGLYVTFFTSDEQADRALPPVGPLYNLVLRQKTLVAGRRTVMQAQELGVSIDRWLEAELEMQRATGEEPGGTKRSEKRVSGRNGVFLRFAVFGESNEAPIAPELGPYAAVVVGTRSVEADGTLIATRAASDLAPWELSRGAGDDLDGVHKPDIAFRTADTSYHPSITPEAPRQGRTRTAEAPAVRTAVPLPPIPTEPAFTLPPRIEGGFRPAPDPERLFFPPQRTGQVFTPTPQPEVVARAQQPEPTETLFVERPKKQTEIYSARGVPTPSEDTSLTPGDRELLAHMDRQRSDETLRARIHEGERQRLGIGERALAEGSPEAASSLSLRYRPQADSSAADEEADDGPRAWGPALWRMRFAIVGVLVLLVGVYAFVVIRTGGAPTLSQGPQATQVVSVGQRFTAPGWEFVANGVTRVDVAGNSHARGIFLVVRLAAVNTAPANSQLATGSFTLVDTHGARYAPEGISTATYQGGPNAGTTYAWGDDLASARTVALTLLFDIDPALTRGLILQLTDAPHVQLKLD